jgi:hypothetical protein
MVMRNQTIGMKAKRELASFCQPYKKNERLTETIVYIGIRPVSDVPPVV